MYSYINFILVFKVAYFSRNTGMKVLLLPFLRPSVSAVTYRLLSNHPREIT